MLILVVPVSSGHLARRLLAGPVEVTGNGRSQIRCGGGSPLSCTIILLVQRYLCSSISSPVAAPVLGSAADRRALPARPGRRSRLLDPRPFGNNLTHRSKHDIMR